MEAEKNNLGKKVDEYSFGYGYCQCGCGKKTVRLSNGTPLRYCANHGRIDICRQKEKIGAIIEGYAKGWGLCQCGCGKETAFGWKKVRNKKVMVPNKYYKFHYSKTEESRRRQSVVGTKVLMSRDYSPFANYGRSKHGLYLSKKLGYEVGYMSTYEKLVFEILDDDSEVENYIPQPFGIEYFYEGVQKTYNPDILIHYKNGKKLIIEVKPQRLLDKPMNQAKFEALKIFCKQKEFDFEIWDENVIKSKAELFLRDLG